MALDFARTAKFRDVMDLLRSQQRFIASMQGRDVTYSNFIDDRFDEVAFEAQLTAARTPTVICLYWIRKLKARYLSGDYVEAQAAADKAKELLRISTIQLQLFDYFYYAALTVAALYEEASAGEQTGWRELLTAHREQLREWAENYAPTFSDKHALVSAELARIEGRDADAMRLYEHSIQSAHEHGFVQNEGVAYEVAARFYASRGAESIAHKYRREARECYNQWGALGKVKQLDERYPRLREERLPALTASTFGTPVRELDVETVFKASQALSIEIVLPKLIETLMRITVEHAGAERALLILLSGDEPKIEAEAITGHGKVEVTVRQTVIRPLDLSHSALQYVIRTREHVVLDDASAANLCSEDEYVKQKRPRSVLCVPIVKQTKLIGALYLENNLTPQAFTADRLAVLELLASQAAISIENATLFSDLERSEAYLAQGQSVSHTGSFGWSVVSGEIYWSEETYKIFEYDRGVEPTLELVFQRIHPDDRDPVQQALNHATNEMTDFDFEHRLLMPDGSFKHLHVIGHALKVSSGDLEFVGVVTDVTAAKRTEETLRESEAYLSEAQRLSHTGSWAWVPATAEIRYRSEECYRVLGFDPQGGPPRVETFLQRIHSNDQARSVEQFEKASREKTEFEFDYRIVHPGGNVRGIHTIGHPVFSPSGDLVEFVGTVMDVTERKRGEQATRLLAAVVESSHDAIVSKDLDGRITSWNQAAERLFGYAAEEAVGQNILLIIPPGRRDEERAIIERLTRGEQVDHFETVRVRKDGSLVDVALTISPMKDAEGRIVGASKLARDITERKRAEEDLRQAQADLEYMTRVTTMGELTASLAHEIRQPISAAVTNAKTCLRWLGRDEPDLPEASEAASRIVKDVTRAADIIGRISALFKKGELQRELVDGNELIREMTVLLRSEANRYSVSIRTELADDLPKVMADRVQLQQVFMNLMLNGIDAMKETTSRRELSIKSQRGENGQVQISVSDTGVGLPPQQADKIFNAFFTTKPHGTGMGLRISQSIIESHGGRLWASDNSPCGATFQFTLPATAAAHA
jgi:PAS domain S-box-containing protein